MFFHPKSKLKWNEGYFITNENIIEAAINSYEQGDYLKSIKIWSKYAPYGCPASCVGLAMSYWKGHGVAQDLKKSFYWMIRGTLRKEDPQLYYNLAVFYEMEGIIPKNPIRTIFCALIAKQLNKENIEEINQNADNAINRVKDTLHPDEEKTYEALLMAVSHGFILNCETFGLFREMTEEI
jgi:TPR repeat protein